MRRRGRTEGRIELVERREIEIENSGEERGEARGKKSGEQKKKLKKRVGVS